MKKIKPAGLVILVIIIIFFVSVKYPDKSIFAFEGLVGETELHTAAMNDDAAVVKKLLKDKSIIDKKNSEGETPLYTAINHSCYNTAKFLINSGADVKTADIEGITLLHLLAYDDSDHSAEITGILIKLGADVNAEDFYSKTPLHGAASSGNIKVFNVLLENGADINCQDEVCKTPLIIAVDNITSHYSSSSVYMIKKLIEKKADVNIVSSMEGSAMHYVALLTGSDPIEKKRIQWLFKTLLKAGADINLKNIMGYTPLHKAVEINNIYTAGLLLGNGALSNIQNEYGESAYSLACKNQHKEILALIKKAAVADFIKIGGIEFVQIPSGNFLMGSQGNDCSRDELPAHSVKIREFYMSRYEITQNQYKKFTGSNPARTQEKYDITIMTDTGNFPVENVGWDDALAFCKVFGEKNGVKARLPYEAEWEYACRSGSVSEYYWGDTYEEGYAVDYMHNAFSRKSSRGVGRMRPNRWGLFDMCGNVKEWCMDWYDAKYYSVSPADNPHGPASGKERVLRGGCFASSESALGSSRRDHDYPNNKSRMIGFRIVVEK